MADFDWDSLVRFDCSRVNGGLLSECALVGADELAGADGRAVVGCRWIRVRGGLVVVDVSLAWAQLDGYGGDAARCVSGGAWAVSIRAKPNVYGRAGDGAEPGFSDGKLACAVGDESGVHTDGDSDADGREVFD